MKKNEQGILIILATVCLVVMLYIFGDKISELKEWGYLGAFIITLISSGTIIFPAPGWAVVLGLAPHLNPLILGIVAGLGSGLGEMTGYFAGLGGHYILDKKTRRLQELTEKYGPWIFFILSVIPNVFFDIAGIIAGASKIKIYKFLIPVILGKIIRYVIICYAVTYGIALFS